MRGPYFERLTLTGATAADALELPLGEGLTFLTGGCGSFKTALASLLRFAVGAPLPVDEKQRADFSARVSAALGDGTVTVHVVTAQGARYAQSRKLGAAPILRDADGVERPGVKLDGELFSCQVFAPHEIEGIAESPEALLALLDRFEEVELRRVEAEIAQLDRRFIDGAAELRRLSVELRQDAERTAELPQLEEALKGMRRAGGPDGASLARAHEDKATRGRERMAIGGLSGDLADVREATRELAKLAAAQIARSVDASLEKGAHADVFRRAHAAVQRAAAAVEDAMRRGDDAVALAEREVSAEATSLAGMHAKEDEPYAALLAQSEADQEHAAARERVQGRYDELCLLKKRADERRRDYESQEAKHRALLEEKVALLARRWTIRKGIEQRVNRLLVDDGVRVEIVEAAGKRAWLALLQDILKGSGVLGDVIEAVAEGVSPADLAAAVRDGDPTVVMRVDDRPTNKRDRALRLLGALRDSLRVEQIELAQLTDVATLSMKVNGTPQPSSTLSTGQARICVLVLLLHLAKGPVVIDEPELSLDDSYIASVLVPAIRAVKKTTQLVLISHHPTLIVLSDPDRIVRVSGAGGRAAVERHGSLREMRDVVEKIDGGAAAFLERARLYGHKVDE